MAKIESAFIKPIYLGAPVRTPIGKFGGTLKRLAVGELAALTLKECIHRASEADGLDLAKGADWVLMGHARQAGGRPNPARQATISGGLAESVPAITINQACASGLASVIQAAEKIALGRAKMIYAGGVESMSNTPYLLMQGRWGLRMGNTEILDGMTQDGFLCPMANMLMGATVDTYLAKEMGITRQEQDAYALESQRRAEAAWKAGHFKKETFTIPGDAKNPDLSEDEHRRPQTTMESLAKLPPVFDKATGTVTAGNASGIVDGSAFMQVTSDRRNSSVVELMDYETIALDPRRMGLGPIESTQRLLARHNLKVADLESVEINEAFAAQVIACNRALMIPTERLNPRGGSIAIGHPIGATGTRILVTLSETLRGKPGALGVATLCVSGGMGVAVLVRAL
ncbi:MAG: thiolase family protein [Bdellovibrionales bacterium]|nr:thiolase family protein [Bdellovibrionales bacterium]